MEFIKKHKILSHPIIGAIILMVYGVLFYQVIGILFSIIYTALNGNTSNPIMYIGSGIGGILLIIIHKLWFKNEYKGSISSDYLFEKSIILAIIINFIVDVFITILGINRLGFAAPTTISYTASFMASFGEEAVYRVLAISIMMRYYKDHDNYLPALIISTLAFGLVHLLNAMSGASISITIGQVIATIATGLFFGAIYLRTGNVVWPLIIHYVHDFICCLIASQSTGVITGGLTLADVFENGLLAVVQIILAIYLLKGHKDDIMATWKNVWKAKA